jgi:2TM domain
MSGSEMQPQQTYSQEDVQHILQLAIAKRTDPGELSREQLWEIAAELDIDNESMQAAEREWLDRRFLDKKRQEFAIYRRDLFKQKTIKYLIVNIFLISLDSISGGTLSWSLYILLIWGLGLSLDGWKTFQNKGAAYEQAFQRWNLKNEMKQSLSSFWSWIKQSWQTPTVTNNYKNTIDDW